VKKNVQSWNDETLIINNRHAPKKVIKYRFLQYCFP
jgi:hypothetical protein